MTFNWLNLQEASQSCPAETLFLIAAVVCSMRLNGADDGPQYLKKIARVREFHHEKSSRL